jgi:hypothetical protein
MYQNKLFSKGETPMKTQKIILTLVVLLVTASNALASSDPVVGTWKGRYTDNKGRKGRIRKVKIRGDGTISGQWQEKLSKYGLSGTAWMPLSGTWTNHGGAFYSIDNLFGTKKVQGYRTKTTVTAEASLESLNKIRGTYRSTIGAKVDGRWHYRTIGGKFFLNRCKPARPKNVNATNGTYSSSCDVTWNPVFGATEYRVYRSRKRDSKKRALGPWQSQNYYYDETCPAGKRFYYRVRARNSAGRSPYSKYDRGWRTGSTTAAPSLAEAAQDTLNEHLYALDISRGLARPVTADGIFNHQFFLEAETDDTIRLIDVTTPAGANFAITDDPNTQSGPVETWHYQDQNNHYWQYQAQADDPNELADYTDGLYTITVTYQTGGQSTTTLEFADPNTGEPIPQPTEQPVLTAPEDNATIASPVTFTWQPCSDGNVTSICLDLESQDTDDDLFMLLSPDDSEAGPASLTPGTWQAQLSFENFFEFDNPDGVPVSAGKFTTTDCTFDVEQP